MVQYMIVFDVNVINLQYCDQPTSKHLPQSGFVVLLYLYATAWYRSWEVKNENLEDLET